MKPMDIKTLIADATFSDCADWKPYQAGRHSPRVYQDGNGYACVSRENQEPPKGFDWRRKHAKRGMIVWLAG